MRMKIRRCWYRLCRAWPSQSLLRAMGTALTGVVSVRKFRSAICTARADRGPRNVLDPEDGTLEPTLVHIRSVTPRALQTWLSPAPIGHRTGPAECAVAT